MLTCIDYIRNSGEYKRQGEKLPLLHFVKK